MLVPGTQGGAGGITPVARDIVRRVPRTQVWIVDRREQAFEDTSVFERRDPDAALDYYLGFKYHARPRRGRQVRRRVGAARAARDLRSVVQPRPRRRPQGDPRRALGRRLDGGGVRRLGLRRPAGLPRDRRPGADRRRPAGQLLRGATQRARSASWPTSAAATSSSTCSASGIPEIAGIFAQVGALYAYERPDAPSALQDLPAAPDRVQAAVPRSPTRGCSATRSTRRTSPKALELIHIRAGRLAASGDPRRGRTAS